MWGIFPYSCEAFVVPNIYICLIFKEFLQALLLSETCTHKWIRHDSDGFSIQMHLKRTVQISFSKSPALSHAAIYGLLRYTFKLCGTITQNKTANVTATNAKKLGNKHRKYEEILPEMADDTKALEGGYEEHLRIVSHAWKKSPGNCSLIP